MKQAKKDRLEAKGWRVGTTAELLGLTPEEEAFIELKLSLCTMLKKKRTQKHMSQVELAKRIKSSQSRVAKMEAGAASVSVDLLIKSLFALGTSQQELANAISTKPDVM
jgi:ribosome-binding protein aMBF1 (putative translation factor)